LSPHILLFDIDGTLVSTGGAGRYAFEAALLEVFGLAELRGNVQMSGRTDRGIAGELFTVYGIADSTENWQQLKASYLRRLPRELVARTGRILPGVTELLARLVKMPNIEVGLLTGNMEDGARAKLGHYALFHHFKFGAFGDHHRDRDSIARDALQIARHHAGGEVPAEQIWVIGDTPLDIQCARAIGAKSVAVATGIHSLEELSPCCPDIAAANLAEIPHLIEMWS